MAGPTQAVTPQAKPEEKQQQLDLQAERLPERPPQPYAQAREKLREVLENGWGKGSEPYAEMFLKQLDAGIRSADPQRQELAKDVYQGFLDGNLKPLKLAIQAFEQTVTEHHHKRTEESVKRLSESLNRIEAKAASIGAKNNSEIQAETKLAEKPAEAEAQPNPEEPKPQKEESPALEAQPLPERPPESYAQAREELRSILEKAWGKGSEAYAEMFLNQLDAGLSSSNLERQELAKNVYQGILDRNLKPLNLAIQGFEQKVTEHHHKRSAESVKRLSEGLNRIEGKAASNGAKSDPEGQAEIKLAEKPAEAETQPEPEKPKQQKVELSALPAQHSRVSFHRPTNGLNVTAVNRTLQLSADGSVQMQFRAKDGSLTFLPANDPSSGLNVTALFVHEGKVYDAEGKQVQSLRWNGNPITSRDALRYAESPVEGKLSGIRDGFLKSMTYDGQDVVFTAGLPPKLSSTGEKSVQNASDTSVTLEKQAQRQTTERAVNFSKISFSQPTSNGTYRGVRRDLRLNADGQLQMRFKGAVGESVWLEAKDHTTGVKVDCLHHHQGRLYDAKGNEVRELNWGGSKVDAAHVIKYMAQTEPGRVSGLKEGYLNDVRLGDRHIVFTEGLPANVAPKPSAELHGRGNRLGTSSHYPPNETYRSGLGQSPYQNGGRLYQTNSTSQHNGPQRFFRARRR